ncbi:MAG: T9SS C-terminal target domain-containing protein [Bacteroidetes bacterium]|nr:MAG: T9SS C-terminal target domain-containing protein [Bacteroidota bacterium]
MGYDHQGLRTRPRPAGEPIVMLDNSTAMYSGPSHGRLRVQPNPAADSMIQLYLEGYDGRQVEIRLLDLQGKVLYREIRRLASDCESIRLRQGLPAGVYLVEVRVGQEQLQARIQVK